MSIAPGTRSLRLTPLLLFPFLLAGCDPTDVHPEPGNVVMTLDADVVETDTGVVVNGVPVLSFPDYRKALWLDRSEQFHFGGFDGLDYAENQRRTQSWQLRLSHEHGSEYGERSAVIRYVDHGRVQIDGTEAVRITDPPGLGGGHGVTYESYVRYVLHTRYSVEGMDGNRSDFAVPFHGRMVAGDDVTLTTSGSDDAAPTTATVSTRPMARLVGVENGDPIDFGRPDVPVLRDDEALTLIFDRPLDPARAAVLVAPVQGDGTRAWIQATELSDRWVLAGADLASLVAASTDDVLAYRIHVVEYAVQDSVVQGTLADGTAFALPFAQRSRTTFPFYFGR